MVCPRRPSHPGPLRCLEKTSPPRPRFKVANGAPSCPLARGGPRGVHASLAPWRSQRGRGWGRGGRSSLLRVPELSFKWQRFVIDMPLWQERNKRAAFAFAQFHSGEVSPVRCSGKQFPHKQIISFTSAPRKRFPSLPQSHICMKLGCSTGFERKVMLPNT